ncbi:hypothetical protein BgiMline_014449 [Biomphalaria glabrata]|nr:hypothetical protein BgiMline_013211 [Biomphalaria glabrata]
MASRLSSILRMYIMALFLQLAAAEAEIVSTSSAWAVIPAVLFVVGAVVVVVYVLKGASSDRNPAGNSNSGTNTNTNTSSSTDQNKGSGSTNSNPEAQGQGNYKDIRDLKREMQKRQEQA